MRLLRISSAPIIYFSPESATRFKSCDNKQPCNAESPPTRTLFTVRGSGGAPRCDEAPHLSSVADWVKASWLESSNWSWEFYVTAMHERMAAVILLVASSFVRIFFFLPLSSLLSLFLPLSISLLYDAGFGRPANTIPWHIFHFFFFFTGPIPTTEAGPVSTLTPLQLITTPIYSDIVNS